MSELKEAIGRIRTRVDALSHHRGLRVETCDEIRVSDIRIVCDAAEHNQRLLDLVRQQRTELHEADLISDEEYVQLASETDAVERLLDYDKLKAAHAKELAKARLEEAHWWHQRFAALQAAVKGASHE